MEKPRIVYLGTPEISANALKGLIESNLFDIVGVVTKPDQPVGRKMIMTPSPVALVASEYNIPLHKPIKLNKDYEFIENLKPDLLLTFAYGQIISTKVLALSKYKPLNVHASLLPKYRGAAPIQYAIKDGEKVTGVSLMEMVKEMDAGDVYATVKVDIDNNDNYTSLAQKVSKAGLELLINYLPKYFNNELVGVKQDESKVTFCPSIKKEEEHLDLNLSPNQFVNYVRALSETPGAYLILDNQPFKIFKARVKGYVDNNVTLGTIVNADKKGLIIKVNGGEVYLDEVQKAGKKKIDYKSFVNGEKNMLGVILKWQLQIEELLTLLKLLW